MASSSWGSQLELDNLASLMGDHVVELDYEEDGEIWLCFWPVESPLEPLEEVHLYPSRLHCWWGWCWCDVFIPGRQRVALR